MKTMSLTLVAILAATGCATQNPNNLAVYSSNAVGSTAQGIRVTVTSVEPIRIEMQQGNQGFAQVMGAAGAGILGGVIGNSIGQGQGREIARTLGVVGGAAAGAAIAGQKQYRDGYRISFRYLQDGRWLTGDVKQFSDGPLPVIGADALLYRGGNSGDRVTSL